MTTAAGEKPSGDVHPATDADSEDLEKLAITAM